MTIVVAAPPAKFEVIDNFLLPDDLEKIKDYLLHHDFPWYFNHGVLVPDYTESNLLNFQFAHTFYDNYGPTSPHLNILLPLISALQPSALVRIKANLNPVAPKIVEHGYHVDFDFMCKTAVFYLNTNNGYTKFKTGEVVESVENRLLVFDSNQLHTGATCTDTSARLVINLNYFK